MYTHFARVYDRLMADVDYPLWARKYDALLALFGLRAGDSVLECACGTGSLSLPLARRYALTGLDLSEDMLAIARQKTQAQGVDIPFVQGDMRRPPLSGPFQAVLATCDGVNYLDNGGLCAFFDAAARLLTPGGVLAFDLSTPYKLRHVLGDNTLTRNEKDIALIWDNSFDAHDQAVDMCLDAFVRQQDGRYLRISEEQRQHVHEASALRHALCQAGFTAPLMLSNNLKKPNPRTERWFVISRLSARKDRL